MCLHSPELNVIKPDQDLFKFMFFFVHITIERRVFQATFNKMPH